MSGKGSNRRPQEAPDEQVVSEWVRIFGGLVRKPAEQQQEQAQADHKDVE